MGIEQFKKHFITGGTGFLGGRLIEMLIENEKADILVHVRNPARAIRLGRFNIEMALGSLSDESYLNNCLKNCDSIIHCAHDFSNPSENIKVIETLLNKAIEFNIKSFIYISSYVVYSDSNSGHIDETCLRDKSGWDYSDNKIDIENHIAAHPATKTVPVVILQPTNIYGPYSMPWVIEPVRQLIAGRVVIPECENVCNVVYVDDVCQAIIKSISSCKEAAGERILISGPDKISWKEFFQYYENTLGTHSLVPLPTKDIRLMINRQNEGNGKSASGFFNDPIPNLKKTIIYPVYQRMLKKSFMKKKLLSLKHNIPKPYIIPDEKGLLQMTAKEIVSIRKGSEIIDFIPAHNITLGMQKTAAFIQWQKLKEQFDI